MSESDQQKGLIQWVDLNPHRLPGLESIFHIANGGDRHLFVAKKLKAEGVRAGVPDLFLPVPLKGFHGLFIEMKDKKTKENNPTVSEKQKDWLSFLSQMGFRVSVCYGCDEAIETIKNYYDYE